MNSTRHARHALLALFVLAGTLFADNRYEETYYDLTGAPLMDQPYVIWELNSEFSATGSSDLYKDQYKFWDRYQGIVLLTDAWTALGNTSFSWEFGEKMPNVFYTPLTLSKASFDGIRMGLGVNDAFHWQLAFARTSDPVLSENDEEEAFDIAENNYLLGMSVDFTLKPVYLYFYQPRENYYEMEYKTRVFDMKRSQFNFVYQFHNNSLNDYINLKGNTRSVNPEKLYIRVAALTTSNQNANAYFYAGTNGITLTIESETNVTYAVRYYPGPQGAGFTNATTFTTNTDTEGNACYVIQKGAPLIIEVTFEKNKEEIDDIRTDILLAGAYLVQARAGSYDIIAIPFNAASVDYGVPPDAYLWDVVPAGSVANKGMKSFSFGTAAAVMNLSYNFEVVLFDYLTVKGEIASSLNFTQYPTLTKQHSMRGSLAGLVSADVNYPLLGDALRFRGLAAYHYISESYTTTLYDGTNTIYDTVDDNDNNNASAGVINGRSATENSESSEYLPEIDRNQDGIFDYTQHVFNIQSDNLFFYTRADMNNNSIPDNTEDDVRPDYPFNKDTKGLHASLGLTSDLAFFTLSFNVGMNNTTKLLLPYSNRTLYAKFDSRYTPSSNATVNLFYEIKKTKDTIADPYINDSGLIEEDPLEYQNSIVNTLYVEYTQTMGNFSFGIKSKYLRNDVINIENAILHAGTLGRIEWGRALSELFNVRTAYKVSQINVFTEKTLAGFDEERTLEQVFFSQFSFTPGKVVSFDLLYSFLRFDDLANPLKQYHEHYGAFQIRGLFAYRNTPMVALMSYELDAQTYTYENKTEGRESTVEHRLIIRLMSRY